MKICVNNCSELENEAHCIVKNREELDARLERYPDGCPCGNSTLWKEVSQEFIDGEWCEARRVQKMLDLTMDECLKYFDSKREVVWASMVGETEEERAREGQVITIYFKRKY
jgi:hypothetical protein